MRYAIAQNEWYDAALMPDGWSAGAICINGGRFGWGDARDPIDVLSMSDGEVRAFVERDVLPLLKGQVRPVVIVDLEKPINPAFVRDAPFEFYRMIADAISRIFRVTKEVLEENGIDAALLFWPGRRTWQDRPTVEDGQSLIALGTMKSMGAFDHCDGTCVPIYPPVTTGDKTWRRLNDVTRNSVRFAQTIFGRHSYILPLFQFDTDGGRSLRDGIDEMSDLGIKLCGHCGFWSPGPQAFLQAAGGGD